MATTVYPESEANMECIYKTSENNLSERILVLALDLIFTSILCGTRSPRQERGTSRSYPRV